MRRPNNLGSARNNLGSVLDKKITLDTIVSANGENAVTGSAIHSFTQSATESATLPIYLLPSEGREYTPGALPVANGQPDVSSRITEFGDIELPIDNILGLKTTLKTTITDVRKIEDNVYDEILNPNPYIRRNGPLPISSVDGFGALLTRIKDLEGAPAYDDSSLKRVVDNNLNFLSILLTAVLGDSPNYSADDEPLTKRVLKLEEFREDDTEYDDDPLKKRVLALESATDNDTVYNDGPLVGRVSTLEAATHTEYDDASLKTLLSENATELTKHQLKLSVIERQLKDRLDTIENTIYSLENTNPYITLDSLAPYLRSMVSQNEFDAKILGIERRLNNAQIP